MSEKKQNDGKKEEGVQVRAGGEGTRVGREVDDGTLRQIEIRSGQLLKLQESSP